MKKEANIKDVSFLGWCDRIGRGNPNINKEKSNITLFYDKLNL